MRRLQTRLLQAGAEEAMAVSPPGRDPPVGEQQGRQLQRHQVQQPSLAQSHEQEQRQEQQQQLGGCTVHGHGNAVAVGQQAPAAAAAASSGEDGLQMPGAALRAEDTRHQCATPARQLLPQRQEQREPDSGRDGMQASPVAGTQRCLQLAPGLHG